MNEKISMINHRVSKEDFIIYLENIQNTWEYQHDLNKFFDKHNVVGYFYQPDCTESLLKLLHNIFENKTDKYIEYFCYETKFGKNPIPKLFRDAQGKETLITNAGELYEFLTALYDQQNGKDETLLANLESA